MDVQEKLLVYLEEISGRKVILSACPEAKKLPLYFLHYQFYATELAEMSCVFAFEEKELLQPSQYLQQYQKMKEYLEKEVILIFKALPAFFRNRLFRLGIPFIVPGNQLFLPPLVDFRERMVKLAPQRKFLSYPAQLMVIRELLFKDISACLQKDIAPKLGYTAMSISNAAEELAQRKIIQSSGRKPLEFLLHGHELWNETNELMRSPVKQSHYNELNPEGLPLAGISALSEMSMLSADPLPVYAVGRSAMPKDEYFRQADCEDSAKSLLEIWQYAPILWKNCCVDPFSLYLSLKDDDDPRVQGCLKEMLGKFEW